MKKFMIMLLFCLLFTVQFSSAASDEVYPVRAKVIELLENTGNEFSELNGDYYSESQFVKVRILEGEDRWETVVAEHSTTAYFTDYKTYRLKKGDRVFVTYNIDDSGKLVDVYVTDVVREGYLIFLTGLFVLLILVLGKGQGVKTIVTLSITVFVVIKVLIPLILRGYPPVLTAVALCSGIVLLGFLIVTGWKWKTLAAALGTVAGVIIAGVLALVLGSSARLTGLAQEETIMLMNIPQEVYLNFQGLLFSGIIIGAMGAVMDVGMSIASALYEIKETNPETTFRQLVRSGLNVGRDMMGTMSNTLILAYAGGALNLILLYTAYEVPFDQIINGDYMASEIVRALAGSIGLILTIPITTLIAAKLYTSARLNPKAYSQEIEQPK